TLQASDEDLGAVHRFAPLGARMEFGRLGYSSSFHKNKRGTIRATGCDDKLRSTSPCARRNSRKKRKKKSRHWFKRWESAFGFQIRKAPLGNQPTVCFFFAPFSGYFLSARRHARSPFPPFAPSL